VLLDIHFDIPPEQLLGLPPDPTPRDVDRARRRQGVEILAAFWYASLHYIVTATTLVLLWRRGRGRWPAARPPAAWPG